MFKAQIPFHSQDKSKKEVLTFELYDHSITHRWKNLVRFVQEYGGSYDNNAFLYAHDIPSDEVLKERIAESLRIISQEYPEIWKQETFDQIRNFYFEITQDNLNSAHILFERTFNIAKFDQAMFEKYNKYFFELNHGVHRFEFRKSKLEGLFLNAVLNKGIKQPINPEENHLFELDTKWGELYLSYCHIGESYAEVFDKGYQATPVPQTRLAGDFNLHFIKGKTFNRRPELQSWLNNYFGREVNMKELPLGLVPLGHIVGITTDKDIKDFFSLYPDIGPRINFL